MIDVLAMSSTEKIIRRLFKEAKERAAPTDVGQAPAFEAVIMLRGVPMALRGALSETVEGGLRMMSAHSSPGQPVEFMEQFFDYIDVVLVAVSRTVAEPAPSRLLFRG